MNYFSRFNFRYVPPIDFIFTVEGDFEVMGYRVRVEYGKDDLPVSDHFPVYADLIISKMGRKDD
jgi:endonuclease/exonuclease/phosphatase family metal-dependent hydrolase